MKLINIEDKIYKISNSEFNILNSMSDDLKSTFSDYKSYCQKEDEIRNHINTNIHKYKLVGTIQFDFRS